MNNKICPTCGTENNSSEMMCGRCMADISAVIPDEKIPQQADVEKENIKIFILHNENKIEIKSGDIIGREFCWSSYLINFMTVSRRHVSFNYRDGVWFAKDENSSNGTYINGEDIRGMGEVKIKAGDKIAISKSLAAEIKGE